MAEKNKTPYARANVGATQRILEYLRKNADMVIPYAELKAELKLPDYTVSNSISYLIGREIADIQRPIKGMVIYHSGKVDKATAEKAAIAEQLATKGIAESGNTGLGEYYKASNADKPKMAPLYEFVGKMEAYSIIRDEGEALFVAMPLMEWLQRG